MLDGKINNSLYFQDKVNMRQVLICPYTLTTLKWRLTEFQLDATEHEQVDRLLEHLERGPTWRFHAFLRACALTDQEHIINILGFDPNVYVDERPKTNGDVGSRMKLTRQLLRGKIKLNKRGFRI